MKPPNHGMRVRVTSYDEQGPPWRKAYASTARAIGVTVPNAAEVSATVARQWHQGMDMDAARRAERYGYDTPLGDYWDAQSWSHYQQSLPVEVTQ